MAVKVVYKPVSEHATRVEEYLNDFRRRTGHEIEKVDPDTSSGASLCRLYDIVEYPTIIAVSDDGHLRNMWRGLALPPIDEVSYYVQLPI